MIAAGSEELEPGGHLAVTYAKNLGNAKIYTAKYEPPQSEASF